MFMKHNRNGKERHTIKTSLLPTESSRFCPPSKSNHTPLSWNPGREYGAGCTGHPMVFKLLRLPGGLTKSHSIAWGEAVCCLEDQEAEIWYYACLQKHHPGTSHIICGVWSKIKTVGALVQKIKHFKVARASQLSTELWLQSSADQEANPNQIFQKYCYFQWTNDGMGLTEAL